MVVCNTQCVVKVCCYLTAIFCVISPNFHISNKVSLLYKTYAICIIGVLLYLFQYYVRAKFVFLFQHMPLLFIVLDLLDCSIPLVAAVSAIAYAAFLKPKTFLSFSEKFIESDIFLGERYSNTKKNSILLLIECLSLCLFYIFFFSVLTYLVDVNLNVHYSVPKYNIFYCIATALFLLSTCNTRVFIVLIQTTLYRTNKKLSHNIDGILAFTGYKQLPHFLPKLDINPFLVQYKTCFELIRHFNEYFGFQVFILTCASFLVLVNNMYLSTLKLKGTVMEVIPPYILFIRHIANTAMYLVVFFIVFYF